MKVEKNITEILEEAGITLQGSFEDIKKEFEVDIVDEDEDEDEDQNKGKQACCTGCRHRPFTAEAPPIGKIHPFSKMAVTFEPVMQFGCPLRLRISFIENRK